SRNNEDNELQAETRKKGKKQRNGKKRKEKDTASHQDAGEKNFEDEDANAEAGWDDIDNGMSVSSKSKQSKTRGQATSTTSSGTGTTTKKNGKIEMSSFPSILQDFAHQAKLYLRYLYVYDDPFPVDDEEGITKHEYVTKALKQMKNEQEGRFRVAWSYLGQSGNENMMMNMISFAWYGRGYLSGHLVATARSLVPSFYGFTSNPDPEEIKDQVNWLLTRYMFTFDKVNAVTKTYDRSAPFSSKLLVNVIQETWFPTGRKKMDLKAATQARKEKRLTVAMVLLAATAIAHILREYSLGVKPLTTTNFTETGAKTYYTGLKIQWDSVKEKVPGFERFILKDLFKRAASDFDVFTQVSQQAIADVDFEAIQAKFSGDVSSDDGRDGGASEPEPEVEHED
ncbi:hypothetical protein CVT24_002359, partial [Panaeolus cyanescens]